MYVNGSKFHLLPCDAQIQALQTTFRLCQQEGWEEISGLKEVTEICFFPSASLDFTACCYCEHHPSLTSSTQHLQFFPEAVNRIQFPAFPPLQNQLHCVPQPPRPTSKRQTSTSPPVHYPQRAGSLHQSCSNTSTR